ncbi:histidine kinase [Opitutaceae bacterium TAV5]|nr:histidine kinase [Opitutaceae bacterium TAV5]
MNRTFCHHVFRLPSLPAPLFSGQWRQLPAPGWKRQFVVALLTALAVGCSLVFAHMLARVEHSPPGLLFWPASGVLLVMLLAWGIRNAAGIFVGSLVVFFIWRPSWHAPIHALDETVQAALACLLVRWFWPASKPWTPGARFFAILLSAGALVPTLLVSLPVCYFLSCAQAGGASFWSGYVRWCLGEFNGFLIVAPFLLLVAYPSFRETIRRPLELALLIPAGLAVMSLHSAQPTLTGLTQVESWALVAMIGFLMVVRCGVGGVIIANVAMTLTAIVVQLHFSGGGSAVSGERWLLEFNTLIVNLTGVTLILAGGFHDHWRAEQALHDVSARMLNAQEAERRRLASDLHDGVSQTMAGSLMRLQLAMARQPALSARPELQALAGDIADGLRDLRRTVAGLRPEMLEHSAFANVLDDHCRQVETRTGNDVLFSDETGGEADRLPLAVREHLFRLVQEAIGNAVQHGRAPLITVTVSRAAKPGRLRFCVEDNGKGFNPAAGERRDRPHLGLRVMQERALLIGATLKVESAAGAGTRIILDLPDRPPAVA